MEDEGGGRTSKHGSILQMTDHVFSGFSTNTNTHTNTNTYTNKDTKQKYKYEPVYTDLLSK